MVSGANTTDYVLDGQSVVRTLLNGVVDRTYRQGPRGPEYERVGNYAPTWYLYDGLGSVLGTVDAAGNIVSARKYDVYGGVRQLTGGSGTRHQFVGNLGHPSDDETGLIYMRARYYDPVTGRFASEDPARHGNNWYVYVDSNATNYVDRSGENPTRAQLFWAAITFILTVTGALLGGIVAVEGAVGLGTVLAAGLLGIISLAPGGLGLAMSIGLGLTAAAPALAAGCLTVIAIAAATAAILALFDDTFGLNELFGSSEPITTPEWLK